MKTYRVATLSLFTLLLAALVGSSYANAFTPGYAQPKPANLDDFQCATASLQDSGAVDALTYSAAPQPPDVSWAPRPNPGDLVPSTDDQSRVPPKGTNISAYTEYQKIKKIASEARTTRPSSATAASSKKKELTRDLDTALKNTATKVTAIQEGMKDTEVRDAMQGYNDVENPAYATLAQAIPQIASDTNAKADAAWAETWGNSDSENKVVFDAVNRSIGRTNTSLETIRVQATRENDLSCEKQRQIETEKIEDLAVITRDASTKLTLETTKHDNAIAAINSKLTQEKTAGEAKRNADVTLEKETGANAIIAVIEEKEGQKVEDFNAARDAMLANQIAAEDEITAEEENLADLVATENSTANDELAGIRTSTEEEVTALRDGISSRVDEVNSQFSERFSQALDKHKSNMSTITSRWSGRISEARNQADAARKVLRKQPSANWTASTRRQLLQAQRKAAAQLASALKSLRYSKITRDRQLAKEKTRYKQQVAAIKKQQRQQQAVVQGPVNQQIAVLNKKMQADMLVITQRRDTAIARLTAQSNQKIETIRSRMQQANNTLASDLATKLAALERQKLQESTKISRETTIKVSQIDAAWNEEKANLEGEATKEKTAVESDFKTEKATIEQASAAATLSTNRKALNDQNSEKASLRSQINSLQGTFNTTKESAVQARETYITQTRPTQMKAWTANLTGKEGIITEGAEAVATANGTYDEKATTARETYNGKVSSAVTKANTKKTTNEGLTNSAKSRAQSAILKIKSKK